MDPNGPKEIKILQINVGKSMTLTLDIMTYAKQHGYDIVLIQEPHTNNKTGQLSLPAVFKTYQLKSNGSGRVKAAVIIIKETSTGILLTEHSNSNIATVSLTVNGENLFISSLYFEPDVDITDHLLTLERLVTLNGNFILAGDINGKSEWWQSTTTDQRGEQFSSLLQSSGLYVLNTGSVPTFDTTRNGRRLTSRIDVTAISNRLFNGSNRWSVLEDVSTSDHNAIVFSIYAEPSVSRKSPTLLFKPKQADWTKFSENLALSDLCQIPLESKDQIDRYVQLLTQRIRSAAEMSMPKRSHKRKETKPWWTVELTELRDKVRSIKQSLKRIPERYVEYVEQRKRYKEVIQRTRTKSWKEFCATRDRENAWSTVYRLLKNLNVPQSECMKIGNTVYATAPECAKVLAHNFYPTDPLENETSEQTLFRNGLRSEYISGNDVPFTEREIEDAMRSFNANKSPGHDNLTSDILLQAFKQTPVAFTYLFNACLSNGYFPATWKRAETVVIPKPGKDRYDNVSGWRPIGLLPVLGKVLEKLFIRRLQWLFTKERRLNGQQFGFTAQKSTEMALTELVEQLKQRAHVRKQLTVLISLDIKGAFDNAWWPFILHQLRQKRCPSNIYSLIESYLTDRYVTVNYGGATYTQPTCKGCVQGSVCGPFFWNLILDDLLEQRFNKSVSIQAFADDVTVVISADKGEELESIANETLKKIFDWGKKVKLTFSEEKTAVVLFNRRISRIHVPRLSVNGTDLSYSDHAKVLGVIIDKHLNWIDHVKYITKKAVKVTQLLYRVAKPTWGCSSEVLRQIYVGAVEPTVTYAASVWAKGLNRKGSVKLLLSMQRQILLRVCKTYRTVSNNSLYILANVLPLDLRIKEVAEVSFVKRTHTLSGFEESIPDALYHAPMPVSEREHPSKRHIPNVSFEQSSTLGIGSEIFTDGSRLEDGSVGCALVRYENGTEKYHRKFKLARCCSIFQAEALAVYESLQLIKKRTNLKNVTVYSDSQSVLKALMNVDTVNELILKSLKLYWELQTEGRQIKFNWIKAHVGHTGNERADVLAKEAASSRQRIYFDMFPLTYAKRIIRNKFLKQWNDRYVNGTTATVTKKFLPTIYQRRYLDQTDIDFHTSQILTGHGAFRQYLYRFKLSSSSVCYCGAEEQTVDHVLRYCNGTVEKRTEYVKVCTDENTQPWTFSLKKRTVKDALIKFAREVTKIIRCNNGSNFERNIINA